MSYYEPEAFELSEDDEPTGIIAVLFKGRWYYIDTNLELGTEFLKNPTPGTELSSHE